MDNILTAFFHIFIVATIVLVLHLCKLVKLNKAYLLGATVVYFLYYLSIFTGNDFIYALHPSLKLQWNWGGKLCSLLICVLTVFYLYKTNRNFKLSDIGCTFSQSKNHIFIVMLVFLFIVLLPFIRYEFSIANKDIETILFQASLPGLAEEPMFSGILLYMLGRGVSSKSVSFLKARVDCSCAMSLLLFGLGHGFFIENYEFKISYGAIISTMLYGAVFLWFRLVTGSFLVSIFVHNFGNVSSHVFEHPAIT